MISKKAKVKIKKGRLFFCFSDNQQQLFTFAFLLFTFYFINFVIIHLITPPYFNTYLTLTKSMKIIKKLYSFSFFTIAEIISLVRSKFLNKGKDNNSLNVRRKIIEFVLLSKYSLTRSKNYFAITSPDKRIFYARVESSDLKVFNHVCLLNEYDAVTKYIEKNKIEIKNIVDCGANVGYASMYFSQSFPSARIISIEPDFENMLVLEKNVRSNHLNNIEFINKAIWHKKSFLKIDKNFRDGENWSFSVSEVSDPKIADTEAISILEIMEAYSLPSIDLLKIDIEGAERYLFQNYTTAISFLSKTKCLAIEIHDEFKIRSNIYEILDKAGFQWLEADELTIAHTKVM